MRCSVSATLTDKTAVEQLAVWRETVELAERVSELSRAFPPEERDWLTDPIRHAARSAAERIADGWEHRRHPEALVDGLTAAEADLHEVQTWALIAMRHHLWPDDVADDVDRRCESILDALSDMVHHAARWCGPAVPAARRAA
jgi:four helix bundle protein